MLPRRICRRIIVYCAINCKSNFVTYCCPAPHGAGGLKSLTLKPQAETFRPAPHGAGGLKYRSDRAAVTIRRPAPHGAGGLKYKIGYWIYMKVTVPPRTGRVD